MAHTPGASDALANERTFLAYLRTSLSFIAFGFVIARFALFTREFDIVLHLTPANKSISTSFGTAVAVFGAAIAIYGGYRFAATARALKRGEVADLSPALAVIGAVAVAIVGVAVGAGLIAFR